VTSSRVVEAPFRYLLLALGTVKFALLASYFVLGDAK
jgi:hypothetical protein